GPCIQVADTGGWLRSGDVGTDARFPVGGPRAAEVGVGSLLSVSVTEREEPLGALNLYSDEPGAFVDRDVVDLALVYATHATTALSSARRATTLRAAVRSRHVIGMAQGIAMERYDIDQHQSFELLRLLSSTTNVKQRDIANQIAETRAFPHGVQPEPVDE
ncbi:MAG: GAF and ANTAR domain-containing protein, partial [Actinobacteria bacterium]|nr:GAF and ANTAR domain-containing protein [Actinomycetota bacterium]